MSLSPPRAGRAAPPPSRRGRGRRSPAPPRRAPATQPAPYPADAVKRLKAGEAAELKPAFVNAVSDLAWFELYFAEDPQQRRQVGQRAQGSAPARQRHDRPVGGVARPAPEPPRRRAGQASRPSPTATRCGGRWGSSASRAPTPRRSVQADDRAKKLLADYPRGLVAAIIRTDLASQRQAARAARLRRRVGGAGKFPKDWMEILNQPTAYYKISADVPKVAHRYGEPLMGQVRIGNVTDYDITVGEGGVLRPDLWFDAKLGGLANQMFPGVAYDRISRYIVLPARTGLLPERPHRPGPARPGARGEPQRLDAGAGVGGDQPGGDGRGRRARPRRDAGAVQGASRGGLPALAAVAGARRRAPTALESGTPGEKIRNLDLVAAYVQLLGATKDADEPTRAAGVEFANALRRPRRRRPGGRRLRDLPVGPARWRRRSGAISSSGW